MWKIAFGASPLVPNGVHSFQVGSKNRSKIDQKSFSTWEALLASIFHGFWSILEAKMEPCWPGKSIKNRSQKALKNRCEKIALLDASWPQLGKNLGAGLLLEANLEAKIHASWLQNPRKINVKTQLDFEVMFFLFF